MRLQNQKISKEEPDFIVITVKTMQVWSAIELIDHAKSSSDPVVICGGNHIAVDQKNSLMQERTIA